MNMTLRAAGTSRVYSMSAGSVLADRSGGASRAAQPMPTGHGASATPTVGPTAATMHSIESERMLLACALLPQHRSRVAGLLTQVADQDFFIDFHANVWSCIRRINDMGAAVGPVEVMDFATSRQIGLGGGPEWMAGLIEDPLAIAASTEAVSACVKRIKSYSSRRQTHAMLAASMRLCESGESEPELVLSQISDAVASMQRARNSASSGPRQLKSILVDVLDQVDKTMEGTAQLAIPTGYASLDGLILGLVPGDCIVLAGRPSMGKTAVCNNLALAHAAADPAMEKNVPALMFSTEMKALAQGRRLLAKASHLGLTKLRKAELDSDEFSRLSDGLGKLENAAFWIDDTPGITMAQIRSRARAFVAEHGTSAIYIDYLGNVAKRDERLDEREHATEVIKGCKELALELNVPVVVLAQLNRDLEKRANKRPIMADLRDSGAIEQVADVILFLYRDEIYNPATPTPGILEIIVAKQRDGAVGTAKLAFNAVTGDVTDLAYGSYG